MIREANWAIDTMEDVRHTTFDRQLFHVERQRRQRPIMGNNKNQELAKFLRSRPLPYLDTIYEYVFSEILDETLSKAGMTVAQAAEKMQQAKETGRPVLFVIHDKSDRNFRSTWNSITRESQTFDRNMRKILADYIVISLHKEEQAALSQEINQPPYEAPNGGWPLFVVARQDGSQLDALSGKWCSRGLGKLLVRNWIDAIGDRELTPRKVKLALIVHRRIGDAPEEKFDALLASAMSK